MCIGDRSMRWLRRAGAVSIAAAMLSGCAPKPGPEVIRVSSAEYQHVFDVAMETARAAGMPAVFRDRRGGVIETDSNVAGSFIEPWRTDNASPEQVMENTIAYQRRKARFEFAPVSSESSGPIQEQETDDANTIDLTAFEGDMELRVWVFVERAHAPGYRRAAWSRRTATRAELGHTEEEIESLATVTAWTPVARDRDYERRMLAEIERGLVE